MRREPLVAPGNDYRVLRSVSDGPMPSVAVLIPVYNRASLLANVLAGLSVQSFQQPFEVVVVDDGSDEDIASVVDRFGDAMSIRLIRQERNGFGTPRARNLGISAVDADVVAFLDADCIPGEEWLDRHIAWHRKASNLVVTGSRRHIDAPLDPSAITDGTANLNDLAAHSDPEAGRFETDDWRRVVYRRSQRLLLGDEGFRSAIGGNSSMRREMVLEVGGMSTDFKGWGGEDTEMAWRLWNAGAFIVPEDLAVIYHQTVNDPSDAKETRRAARERALPLIADHVPHRFYRKEPSHLHTVPYVSWLVTVDDETEADRAWREVSRASYTDTELVLIGSDQALENRRSVSAAAQDLSIAESFSDAVHMARGAVLAIADGRARFDRRLLARAMRRFEDPRVSAVRVGYRSEGKRILRLRDIQDIDKAVGRSGLPFFGLIRRRELMKDRDALADPARAWTAGLDRSKTELLVTDLVEIPPGALQGIRRGLPGFSDLRAAGPAEIARGAKRAVKPTPSSMKRDPHSQTVEEDRIAIEYVGLAGHKNLGDDAMLETIRRLLPWADVGTNRANPRAVMLGGGTLLNSSNYYLNKLRRVDGPNLERIVFGTGVKDEGYWSFTENLDDWEPFLRSALSIGVRGPDSLATMRAWGYDGPIDVIGDPALSIERPDGVEPVDGRVVLCPVYTSGECWGGDDHAVFDEFARTIDRLRVDGRDVVMMTAHPGDDRWAIEIMRRAGHPDLAYLAGYDDVDTALRIIASADLVIGERLHAVVLAAAMGTPFVAVEYRPKLRDFARSVGAEDAVVRTDEVERLSDTITERLDRGSSGLEEIAEAVDRLRGLQRDTAHRFGEMLR